MASLLSEANGGKKYLLMRNKKSRIKITNSFVLVDYPDVFIAALLVFKCNCQPICIRSRILATATVHTRFVV